MTDKELIDEMATLLGWKPTRDRFIKPGGSWAPKWRFRPLDRLEDAFLLLDQVASCYRLEVCEGGMVTAEVRVGSNIGTASGELKARTIAIAFARAIGLGVPQ